MQNIKQIPFLNFEIEEIAEPRVAPKINNLVSTDYDDILIQENLEDIQESLRDSQRALSIKDFNEMPDEFAAGDANQVNAGSLRKFTLGSANQYNS